MSIYCMSDLHGNYSVWTKIKKYLQSDDIVYFLGDAADRGEDGWKIIKELLDNPQIIYLKGNHEDMLVNAIQHGKRQLLFINGGEATFYSAFYDPDKEKIIQQLKELPLVQIVPINNVIFYLSHSGNDISSFKNKNQEDYEYFSQEYLWDRDHYTTLKWDGQENEFIVHGHTFTGYVREDIQDIVNFYAETPSEDATDLDGNPLIYCEGHKIDLDMATAFTNKACLFNLETFEFKIFEGEAEE